MQNYLLELTIKLCLDHETLVCFLAPEFPGESLFKSMSQAQNKRQPGDYKGFCREPEVTHFRNVTCAQGKETQENV